MTLNNASVLPSFPINSPDTEALMDFVTGIPELVERVVKCARFIQDATNVDKAIEFDFQHGPRSSPSFPQSLPRFPIFL